MNDLSTPSPTAVSGGHLTWNAYAAACPTRLALERISDKWTVLILGLLMRQPMRFNAMLRAIEGLSQKVLSQTLKRLERDGLVQRTVFPTVPVSVEYTITALGTSLAGVVIVVRQWAETHIEHIIEAQQHYDGRLPAGRASAAKPAAAE